MATGAVTSRPRPHTSAPTMNARIVTSHTSRELTKFDPTSEKLDENPLDADWERSTTNKMTNWVKIITMSPGRMHAKKPIEVRMSTSSAARNAMPKLRGLKNEPMLTAWPSTSSRHPDRNAAWANALTAMETT